MRYRPRLDATQREVVEALRAAGCSVYSLAALGGGVPDLLVGAGGSTWLIEVKSAKAVRRKPREATPAQELWAARWRGAAAVTVHSASEALVALGLAWSDVVP